MNLAILIPIYKTMDAACVQSLLGMVADLNGSGAKIRFYFANGFNAARARIGLARTFYEEKEFTADYVLWLDSDHYYTKKCFDNLLEALEKNNLDMLSASYKVRGGEETVHGSTIDGTFKHFHYKDLNEMPEGQLFECDVVGFGFLLMKADFLRKMWVKHGENMFKMDIGMNGTEDVAFCDLARKDGYKVMFHPKVRIGHMELCVRI